MSNLDERVLADPLVQGETRFCSERRIARHGGIDSPKKSAGIHGGNYRGPISRPPEAAESGPPISSGDPFDETAIEWRRIAAYEKELNGGSWPQRN
jgi:hypothetical protein